MGIFRAPQPGPALGERAPGPPAASAAGASRARRRGAVLHDSDPPGDSPWSQARADVRAAVDARASAGDENIRVVFFEPRSGPWGEDWHPTAATHARMAVQLAQRSKS